MPVPFDQAEHAEGHEGALLEFWRELRADVAEHGPLALIVVDTLARCMTAPENDTEAMMRFVRGLQRVADEFGCSVLVLHHPPKGGADAKGAGFFRGAGALFGALDVGLGLRRERDGGAMTLNPNEKDAKDDAPSAPLTFRLASVDLGVDQGGRLITSCVLEPSTPPGTGSGRIGGKEPTKTERVRAEVGRLLQDRGPMRIVDMMVALGYAKTEQRQRNVLSKALKEMKAEGLATREGPAWSVASPSGD